jgi:hypothetical protein
MICDYLHSFYTIPALIYVGGVPTTVHLRWFRAPPGAKLLPVPNAFHASSVWENDEGYGGGVGEVYQPRVEDPGRNVGYQGQCYLGDPSWFATGQLPAYVLTQAPPTSPCLCQIPPAQAAGGLVLTGAAVAYRGVATCPQGALAYSWTIVVPAGTGQFAPFVGTYTMLWFNGCQVFHGVPAAGKSWQQDFQFGIWKVRLTSIPPAASYEAQYHIRGVFNPFGFNVWDLFSWSGTGTAAATVTTQALALPN